MKDTVTINDVTFTKGDNGAQRYYDHTAENGDCWVVLQPYSTNPRFRQPAFWWAAHVWRGDAVRNLNLCTDYGTHVIKNPLYDETDPGRTDPPWRLLSAMANLIASGVDPFTIQDKREEK